MKTITKNQENSNHELISIYNQIKELLIRYDNLKYSNLEIIIREKMNIVVKKILPLILKYDIKVDGYENIIDSPVIYASTHQDFNDITNSIYAYPEHILTLNAINISFLLKFLLELNGVVFVDRDSKEDRKKAKKELIETLKRGKSINIYPEGTWNCSPNKLHLPFYIGIIDIAKSTGVPIIPVVQEYSYDESILDGKSRVRSVHIRFGKPIYVHANDDRIEKLLEFDEVLSTIRWELLEEKGTFKRHSIDNKLYTNYIKTRIRDWRIPKNDINTERTQIYGYEDDFYLFHHINDVSFNENDELLPTEYVRKLIKIQNKHLK